LAVAAAQDPQVGGPVTDALLVGGRSCDGLAGGLALGIDNIK